jgi:hypothetical protein
MYYYRLQINWELKKILTDPPTDTNSTAARQQLDTTIMETQNKIATIAQQ